MKHFPHISYGYTFEDNGYWLFLKADPGIIDLYSWLATRNGIHILKGSRHGPHISIIKGEKPKYLERWHQILNKKCQFKYGINVKNNNYHVWLDVKSRDLNDIREFVGLKKIKFHLTIGRLKYYCDD